MKAQAGKPPPSGPKRILALSGGGVRGIVEVAFLEAVEAAYKRQFGQNTRLCDVFHLIGGSSTGALIATALTLGHPLEQIANFYLARARDFFAKRRWWAYGHQALFDGAALEAEIKRDVGDATLGSDALLTYLAVITKRLDTGSPWILSNIPTAPYFDDPPDQSYIGNRHYRLAQILRAATAAPTLFDQQQIAIAADQRGVFVDGGLSPFNDPSLALLQLARLKAFGLNWPAGADRLFVMSVGTGHYRQKLRPELAARLGPLRTAYWSLRGVIADNEAHTLAMMEWLGTSRRPVTVNSEVGSLDEDALFGPPAFSYLRLDLPLEADALHNLDLPISDRALRKLRRLDDPDTIEPLYELTKAYIAKALDLDAMLAEPFERSSAQAGKDHIE